MKHLSDLHQCSKCFEKFADLTQHKKSCQPLQFQCRFCYALFANYEHLKEHLFNHVARFHFNCCEQCNASFETEEDLDTHIWQIHQFKKVNYVFWGLMMCVLGGILWGVLGVILVGASGIIFGADFFSREEDLNQRQRRFIPGWSNPGWSNTGRSNPGWSNPGWSDSMHAASPKWKPKNKKERKKRNRKKVWRRK